MRDGDSAVMGLVRQVGYVIRTFTAIRRVEVLRQEVARTGFWKPCFPTIMIQGTKWLFSNGEADGVQYSTVGMQHLLMISEATLLDYGTVISDWTWKRSIKSSISRNKNRTSQLASH